MQVLEALLRLRQVACHPGLVDESWEEAGSAKLESLFEQVSEILDEGHKVIVFSQFTSLLAYVRKGLDEREIDFAYLDGQTRNRGEVVTGRRSSKTRSGDVRSVEKRPPQDGGLIAAATGTVPAPAADSSIDACRGPK